MTPVACVFSQASRLQPLSYISLLSLTLHCDVADSRRLSPRDRGDTARKVTLK